MPSAPNCPRQESSSKLPKTEFAGNGSDCGSTPSISTIHKNVARAASGKTDVSAGDQCHWLFNAGFPQKLGCFFRRSRIDIETSTPFETRRFGQLGHELNVPMIVIVTGILHRR